MILYIRQGKVDMGNKKDKKYIDFAERLKQARKNAGLTQCELIKLLNKECNENNKKAILHQVEISYYEKGIRKPCDKNMERLAKVLKVDKTWLDLGGGEVSSQKTKYGKKVEIKHIECKKPKSVKVSPLFDKLKCDDKMLVNELIEALAK